MNKQELAKVGICVEKGYHRRLLSIVSLDCQVSLWLASRTLVNKQFLTLMQDFFLTKKGGSVYLDYTNNLVYTESLVSFWNSRILTMSRDF